MALVCSMYHLWYRSRLQQCVRHRLSFVIVVDFYPCNCKFCFCDTYVRYVWHPFNCCCDILCSDMFLSFVVVKFQNSARTRTICSCGIRGCRRSSRWFCGIYDIDSSFVFFIFLCGMYDIGSIVVLWFLCGVWNSFQFF